MTLYKHWAATISLTAIMVTSIFGLSQSALGQEEDHTAKQTHVNIALFHKFHGQESFTYPAHISSHNILNSMANKAQFISINHTAGLKDGDVITIGNDVLRDNAGEFEDFGVDCQIAIHIKDHAVTASGMCEILMVDQDGREIEHKGIIMPLQMQPGKDWVLAYNDTEDGIAVYIDEEVSQD